MAEDRETGRAVAKKLPEGLDRIERECFQREAHVLAKARHPGIVEVLDVGWRPAVSRTW